VRWLGDSDGQAAALGSLALEREDWQGAVRRYVQEEVPEDDPQRADILAAVEELIAEEASA
jgi:hypothetical protein